MSQEGTSVVTVGELNHGGNPPTDRELLEQIHERVCSSNIRAEVFDSILREGACWRVQLPWMVGGNYNEFEVLRTGSIITVNLLQNGMFVFTLGRYYRD